MSYAGTSLAQDQGDEYDAQIKIFLKSFIGEFEVGQLKTYIEIIVTGPEVQDQSLGKLLKPVPARLQGLFPTKSGTLTKKILLEPLW
jgi:hypothetical protein